MRRFTITRTLAENDVRTYEGVQFSDDVVVLRLTENEPQTITYSTLEGLSGWWKSQVGTSATVWLDPAPDAQPDAQPDVCEWRKVSGHNIWRASCLPPDNATSFAPMGMRTCYLCTKPIRVIDTPETPV